MTRSHHTCRSGFTLVEVLVVISLIAVLAAISAAAFFRLKGGQDSSNTEATLSKLHSNLDTKWKVVLDDAKRTVPAGLVTACGENKDRALVVWTYAKLKNELPQTAVEANATINLTGSPSLAPRKVFADVAAKLTPVTVPADVTSEGTAAENEWKAARESGALFYAAITQTGGGGNTMMSDGVQQQVTTEPNGLAYFKDSWGRPVGFVRHATNTEINGPSFSRSNTVSGTPVKPNLDPLGKMVEDFTANGPFRTTFSAALSLPVATFNNVNRVPTVYSAGPNKAFGADALSLSEDDALDNILSYRLRREGARGN